MTSWLGRGESMTDLIITNGDAAAELLAAAGLPGRLLPWRDVLHEGPLVRTAGIEELSNYRASYLAERFGLPYAEVRADFVARDAVLRAHALFDRVAIWVEHDLYDQLQLMQVLAALGEVGRTSDIVLVQADDFLGAQRPETVLRFADRAVPVGAEILQSATAVWAALTAPTPTAVAARAAQPPAGLPHLRPALVRLLEELPAPGTGLSRTETAILTAVARYRMAARDLFGLVTETEEAAFMGDWSLYRTLDDLAGGGEPLVEGPAGPYPCRGSAEAVAAYLATPLAPTALGRRVLGGGADRVAVNGLDRWWGGTRLAGHATWRFDRAARRLVPPDGA